MINDVFDVLNGRFYAQGISNKIAKDDPAKRSIKEKKWVVLKTMLDVLDVTENFHNQREKHSDSPSEMFCSTTTLRALRLTINSAMALTEEMLENDYHTVLTGKWNQDPVEVGNLLSTNYIKFIYIQYIFLCSGFLESSDRLTVRQLRTHGCTFFECCPCTT